MIAKEEAGRNGCALFEKCINFADVRNNSHCLGTYNKVSATASYLLMRRTSRPEVKDTLKGGSASGLGAAMASTAALNKVERV